MTKNVRLKNRSGEYLEPYTENVPTASTSTAGKVKLDSSPTSGSNNAITSGAVYTALAGKLGTNETAAKATADASGNNIVNTYLKKDLPVTTLATSGTISLADNSVNRITPSGTVTFSLPSVSDNTSFHQILVQMNLTASRTINLGTTKYFTGTQPTFATGTYDILYEYNGTNWIVGAVLQA